MCKWGYTWLGLYRCESSRHNRETRLQTSCGIKRGLLQFCRRTRRERKLGEINSDPVEVQSAAGEEAQSLAFSHRGTLSVLVRGFMSGTVKENVTGSRPDRWRSLRQYSRSALIPRKSVLHPQLKTNNPTISVDCQRQKNVINEFVDKFYSSSFQLQTSMYLAPVVCFLRAVKATCSNFYVYTLNTRH